MRQFRAEKMVFSAVAAAAATGLTALLGGATWKVALMVGSVALLKDLQAYWATSPKSVLAEEPAP